jgi:hypothetical protein
MCGVIVYDEWYDNYAQPALCPNQEQGVKHKNCAHFDNLFAGRVYRYCLIE